MGIRAKRNKSQYLRILLRNVEYILYFRAQEALAEQNKLREQLESANSELHAQKSNLASVHTEKNKIIEVHEGGETNSRTL